MSLLTGMALGVAFNLFLLALILINRFSKYAKEQLRSGGPKCRCGNPACDDRNHLRPIKEHRYAEYYLPIDTLKCENCHIRPGLRKNIWGKMMCNQCK